MKVEELFSIEYPKTLICSEMTPDSSGINFVSSQEKNNGVVSKVARIEDIKVYPAGVITVPLKGSVMLAHVQPHPCHIAHQVAVLTSKRAMTLQEKLYYCMCVRANAYRYSYGRQADKTLKDIELPDTIPEWVKNMSISPYTTTNANSALQLRDYVKWGEFTLGELFYFVKGKRLTKEDMLEGETNYLGAISDSNGVRQLIDAPAIHAANCITVNYNGSVGEAFYQATPFWASDDVNILYAKGWTLNKYIALFVVTVIKANRFKFSYGRKWTLNKMKKSFIKLPVTAQGSPDWDYMECYIKSLPYSDRI
jgi:hypothetical protein